MQSALSPKAVPTLRDILSGLDSVYAHWKAPIDAGEVKRLEELKAFAQEARQGKEKGPTVSYGGQVFSVLPSGGRKGEYVLDGDFMTVLVDPNPPLSELPTLSIDIKSIALNQLGILGATGAAQRVAFDLAVENATDEDLKMHVTRVDFFRDVQGWKPRPSDVTPRRASWYDDRNHSLYTRCKKFKLAGEARFESAIYGKKSSGISAEIYNKTLEIEVHSEKGWFRKAWAKSPDYDPKEDVVRIEFRIRREGLTQLHEEGALSNLDTFEDVFKNMQAIWKYLTSQWLVMRAQRTKDDRKTITPFWLQVVEGGAFEMGTRKVLRGHLDQVALNGLRAFAGYLVLGHACIQWFDRNERLSLEETAPRLLGEAMSYVERYWEGGWQARVTRKLSKWTSMTHLQLMGEDVEDEVAA